MTDASLVNHTLIFDPDLDLESVHELPGKDVTAALVRAFVQKKITSTQLVQDSHGWCFKICGNDSRMYLMELIYIRTSNHVSDWVIACDRLSGLRLWECFSKANAAVGLEQFYLDAAVEILVSNHGFAMDKA